MPTFVHHDAGLGSVSVFFLTYTARRSGRASSGRNRRPHRPSRVIVPALGALGCSIAALATVHTVPALALVAVAFGVAQGIVYPTLNAFAIEHVPSGQLGRCRRSSTARSTSASRPGRSRSAASPMRMDTARRSSVPDHGALATALFSVATGDAGARAMRRSSLDSDASASG
jgi:hypothetical protein